MLTAMTVVFVPCGDKDHGSDGFHSVDGFDRIDGVDSIDGGNDNGGNSSDIVAVIDSYCCLVSVDMLHRSCTPLSLLYSS